MADLDFGRLSDIARDILGKQKPGGEMECSQFFVALYARVTSAEKDAIKSTFTPPNSLLKKLNGVTYAKDVQGSGRAKLAQPPGGPGGAARAAASQPSRSHRPQGKDAVGGGIKLDMAKLSSLATDIVGKEKGNEMECSKFFPALYHKISRPEKEALQKKFKPAKALLNALKGVDFVEDVQGSGRVKLAGAQTPDYAAINKAAKAILKKAGVDRMGSGPFFKKLYADPSVDDNCPKGLELLDHLSAVKADKTGSSSYDVVRVVRSAPTDLVGLTIYALSCAPLTSTFSLSFSFSLSIPESTPRGLHGQQWQCAEGTAQKSAPTIWKRSSSAADRPRL